MTVTIDMDKSNFNMGTFLVCFYSACGVTIPTFPLHLFLLMSFRAYIFLVALKDTLQSQVTPQTSNKSRI